MGVVRLYATLRQRLNGEGAVDVPWFPGAPISDVLAELLQLKPELDGGILDEDGNVLRHVSVFINGRDIRHLDGLASPVESDAEVSIFPPIAGG